MKQTAKKNALLLAGIALFGAGAVITPVYADNVVQTLELVRVDVQKLSAGYRASKIIGSNVTNDTNETIGRVDDLIVSPDDNKSAYVILSVGGWLGMGSHLIALPYDSLQISSTKITLPGATKDGLKNLAEFKYSPM